MIHQLRQFTVFFAVSSIVFFGCKEKKDEQPKIPDPVRVDVQNLSAAQQNTTTIQYDGTIQASKTIDLSFQVSGTVISIPVETGQAVRKGQLVAAVDETTYRNQYNAQLAQAKLAEENYNRVLQVYNKGSIAEIKMLQAKSEYEQASSSAKATYQNIVHTKLYAPQDGYIGNKQIEVGATASPGMPVVQLLDITQVDVLVSVPQGEVNHYHKGDNAVVTIDALNGAIMQGVITEIGVLAQQNNASYNIKVSLANPSRQLKPGMLCKVSFTKNKALVSDSAETEIVVPAQSVQVDEAGHSFVFIVDSATQKALRKPVVTGTLYNNGIAVREGLSGTETLITSGFQKLADSSTIQIINQQ